MDRYLLIDPTGLGLSFVPIEKPIELDSGSTSSSGVTLRGYQVTGASEPRMNFQCRGLLGQTDYQNLKALATALETGGRRTETVLYYLWDRISDWGTVPTREAVPGLAPVIGDYSVAYYPVLQGDIVVTGTLAGAGTDEPWYLVNLIFYEGTVRR